ncbi:CopG family transcriptional regulator [Rhodopila globiformis]|uniref:CopG family transcriptional regulator n=1 Tax=Rhodopila globiformis TaxID=1071 RepID=A0A2S6N727_RHOGL|nr:CopG family transcriptional regulator [Rhodopila globiformis]PPQ30416.1 hypothetical protein CCS01_19230 [Rhodopila globiformis]
METIPPAAESAMEKQQRLAYEADLLREAFADVAAGRTVAEAEVDAWIDCLGTRHERPLPGSKR